MEKQGPGCQKSLDSDVEGGGSNRWKGRDMVGLEAAGIVWALFHRPL